MNCLVPVPVPLPGHRVKCKEADTQSDVTKYLVPVTMILQVQTQLP